ncbi:MAG: hypothetical protein R2795_21765 [Saprospiraceae bacterium]
MPDITDVFYPAAARNGGSGYKTTTLVELKYGWSYTTKPVGNRH